MFIGEVVGTAVLILLGDGVVAGVLLNKSKAQNGGWIVITWAWGMAVFVGVLASLAVSGGVAHLNPAVTIGLASIDLVEWNDVPTLIAGQFVGAFIGAILVYLAYLAHWGETDDPGLKLAVFSTGPAIRNTAANLITEIIGTFMLVFGILAISGLSIGDQVIAARSRPGRSPSVCSSWSSACRSVDRPATRSTRRATSDRASCTRSCRSPARARPTGRTRGSRWSARSSAASLGALAAKAIFDL